MTRSYEGYLDYDGGVYETGEVSPSFLGRSFPTEIFALRCMWIIYQAAGYAKKGLYTGQVIADHSIEVLRALESVGVKIELTGLDEIAKVDGPCVFISNHMSTLETLVLPGIVQPVKNVTFVIKRSLIEYPVFKHPMRAYDPIVVDRVNPREDLQVVLNKGPELLNAGRSIVVFPQTTRTVEFDHALFNTLGIKLARRAGVPIVPVAVKSDAWTNGHVLKEFGLIDPSKKVHMSFGPSMTLHGRGNKEHQAVVDYIVAKLDQWKAEEGPDEPS